MTGGSRTVHISKINYTLYYMKNQEKVYFKSSKFKY